MPYLYFKCQLGWDAAVKVIQALFIHHKRLYVNLVKDVNDKTAKIKLLMIARPIVYHPSPFRPLCLSFHAAPCLLVKQLLDSFARAAFSRSRSGGEQGIEFEGLQRHLRCELIGSDVVAHRL